LITSSILAGAFIKKKVKNKSHLLKKNQSIQILVTSEAIQLKSFNSKNYANVSIKN